MIVDKFLIVTESCEDVKCPSGKQCRLRRGIPKCVCLMKCTKRQRKSGKICGTDGRTYNNQCHLRRRNCKREASVSVAYKGVCRRKFFFLIKKRMTRTYMICIYEAGVN